MVSVLYIDGIRHLTSHAIQFYWWREFDNEALTYFHIALIFSVCDRSECSKLSCLRSGTMHFWHCSAYICNLSYAVIRISSLIGSDTGKTAVDLIYCIFEFHPSHGCSSARHSYLHGPDYTDDPLCTKWYLSSIIYNLFSDNFGVDATHLYFSSVAVTLFVLYDYGESLQW